MDNGAMADMGAFFEGHGYARKHVQGAIFLYIAAVFYDNPAPISSNRGARADIYIAADDHSSGDGSLRVNERGRMNDGFEPLEFISHNDFTFPKKERPTQGQLILCGSFFF
jgi:hypothetical protein